MPPSTWTTNSTTAPAKTLSSATRPHQRTVDRPEGSGQCSLPTLARDEPAALSARATEVAAMGVMVVLRLAAGQILPGQILMVLDSSVMNVSSGQQRRRHPDLGWT